MSNGKNEKRKSLRNLEKALLQEKNQLEYLNDKIDTLHYEIYNPRQEYDEEQSPSNVWADNQQNLDNMTLEAEKKQEQIDELEAQIEKLKDETLKQGTKNSFCVYCVDQS
tara:strand:+ start:1192 stop:1521 length:330 start_codon:yes stop_codon:yes gene_type:complete